MASLAMRLIIALLVCLSSLFSYCGSKEYNPVTGEKQYISLTENQEIALGLRSVPEMLAKYGGMYPKEKYQKYIDKVGFKVVRNSKVKDTPWKFEFYLLKDTKTVNAFALPGGQIFVTAGLFRLFTSENQLAAVLSHEIAHVVARHSSQHIAKAKLTRGVTDAVMVASGDARAAQISAIVGKLVNMQFNRDDEIEADRLGVYFMNDAGYNPVGMVELMQILEKLRRGVRQPEFFSTHPSPDNRIQRIKKAIKEKQSGIK